MLTNNTRARLYFEMIDGHLTQAAYQRLLAADQEQAQAFLAAREEMAEGAAK